MPQDPLRWTESSFEIRRMHAGECFKHDSNAASALPDWG